MRKAFYRSQFSEYKLEPPTEHKTEFIVHRSQCNRELHIFDVIFKSFLILFQLLRKLLETCRCPYLSITLVHTLTQCLLMTQRNIE